MHLLSKHPSSPISWFQRVICKIIHHDSTFAKTNSITYVSLLSCRLSFWTNIFPWARPQIWSLATLYQHCIIIVHMYGQEKYLWELLVCAIGARLDETCCPCLINLSSGNSGLFPKNAGMFVRIESLVLPMYQTPSTHALLTNMTIRNYKLAIIAAPICRWQDGVVTAYAFDVRSIVYIQFNREWPNS